MSKLKTYIAGVIINRGAKPELVMQKVQAMDPQEGELVLDLRIRREFPGADIVAMELFEVTKQDVL